jgi:hypothetical protein
VPVALREVDAVEVTLLMDGVADLLLTGSEGVRRFPIAYDWSDHDNLVAEQGLLGAGGVPGRPAGRRAGGPRRADPELTAEAGVLRGHASSHGLGLGEALALVGLTGASPAVRVIGIAGRRFDIGAPPGPAVVRAAASVAARLKEARTCA